MSSLLWLLLLFSFSWIFIVVNSWRNFPVYGLTRPSTKQLQYPRLMSNRKLQNRYQPIFFRTSDGDDLDNAEELFEEDDTEKSPKQKLIKRILFLQRLSTSAIPLATSVGFAVTPSTKIFMRLAGAAAGTVTGFIAKKTLDMQINNLKADQALLSEADDDNNNNNNNNNDDDGSVPIGDFEDRMFQFPQKVSQVTAATTAEEKEYPGLEYSDSGNLRENNLIPSSVALAVERTFTKYKALEDFDLKQLQIIAKGCKVSEEDLGLYFTLLLSEYIYQYTDSESLQLLDFDKLFQFIQKIQFTPLEIADAVTLAANNVGKRLDKDEEGFYADNFSMKTFLQATKLFYLSDKLLGNLQGYYGERAKVALHYFPADEYRIIITNTCQKLMIDTLNDIINSPYEYTPEQFAEIKFLLTTSKDASDFTSEEVERLLNELFEQYITQSLQKSDSSHRGKASANRLLYTASLPSLADLNYLSELFQWNYTKLIQVFEPTTAPFYRKIVKDIFTKVTADSSLGKEYEGVLVERMHALHLPFSTAKIIIKSEVEQLNHQAVHNIMSAFNQSKENIDLTYRQLVSYAIAIEEISKITCDIFPEVKPLSITQFPLQQSQLLYVYTMNLFQQDKLLANGKLSPELLSEMFQLPKESVQEIYRMIVIPKIVSFIQQCIQEKNYRPEAQAAIQKKWQQEGFSFEEYEKVMKTLYYEEVETIQQKQRIPSVEDYQHLQQIAQFLNVTQDTIDSIHAAIFGDMYLQSVEEFISTTGVITPEYMENLELLKERYQLSDQDASNLYSIAILNRLQPNLYAIYDLFKSITDPKYDVNKEQKQRQKVLQKEMNRRREKLAALQQPFGLLGRGKVTSSSDDDDEDTPKLSKYALPPSVLQKRQEEALVPKTTSAEEITKGLSFLQTQDQEREGQRSTFMKEVINLVDFVHENYQLQSFDLSAREEYPIRATGAVNASELVDMYRYYLVSKLLESNPSLKERYDSIDTSFGTLLGISWIDRNRIKQVLLQDIYATTIKNLLETKDMISMNDLQQFYLLADEFNVTDTQLREELYEYTIRRGIDDYAKTFLFDQEDDAPQAKLNPVQARRFRKQLESLGYKLIDLYEDKPVEFFINYYAYELFYLIDQNQLDEISELQEVYEFPAEISIQVLQELSRRMVDELLNLGLRASRKYDEEEVVTITKRLLRFYQFLQEEEIGEMGGNEMRQEITKRDVTIMANGRLFEETDLIRMLQFYGTYIENEKLQLSSINSSSSESEDSSSLSSLASSRERLDQLTEEAELLNKLKNNIIFSLDYQAPDRGMQGLLGTYKTRAEIELDQTKKVQTNVKQSKQLRDFS